MLNHLKWLMVIVYHCMSTIDVHVDFLKTVTAGLAFSFNVGTSACSISQRLTCKGNGVAVLYECCIKPVLTDINQDYNGLLSVEISWCGPEKV